MRLLVTGGTGFIGSHFLQAALVTGHEIVALRRVGSKPRISLEHEPAWLEMSMGQVGSTELANVDVLVHFAAAGVNPAQANWEDCFDVNVTQSLRLWKKALDAKVRRIVICGSCFEYGKSALNYDHIPVDAPLWPTDAYHASKAAATLAAIGLASSYQAEIVVLRPFHVYGEGEDESRLWPSLRRAALAGLDFPMTAGSQVRDFIEVDEVAQRFVRAIDRHDVIPGTAKIENVGHGQGQSLQEFAENWWAKWNASGKLVFGALPMRPNEIRRYVASL